MGGGLLNSQNLPGRNIVLYTAATLLACTIVFVVLDYFFPLKVDVRYSMVINSREGELLSAFLSKDDKWRMKCSEQEISPALRRAFLFKEDRHFRYHPGVNPFSVIRALINNTVSDRRTSGASTITMQLARLLSPAERTYANKITEMFRALQLELHYSKDEIFRLYLDLVPYGGNIEGIKAASLIYFGKSPANLSTAEAMTLAIIPNRPGSLRPGRNDTELISVRNKWLDRMKEAGIIGDNDYLAAIHEPFEGSRHQLPQNAPHLSRKLFSDTQKTTEVRTTIRYQLQKRAETITTNYTKRMNRLGIYNASVIILNNVTREAEVYIGSNDFNDDEHAGQVDGATGIRSPGSLLKPLAYAIAFDKGLLTPKSVIADVPVNYDGYAPENFDSKFNGKVTVEHALATSLNIPAVRTLNMTGVNSFTEKLRLAGFGQAMQTDKSIGLSAVLGGYGARLTELTTLYAAFANNGKFSRMRFIADESPGTATDIVSPPAAWMITQILSTVAKDDLPQDVKHASIHLPRIAWKTGTSYGRRDAWSIGYNDRYTVGVWIGNFSGQGVPELTGAGIATPLLFELFRSLPGTTAGIPEPDGLDFRLVCPESGKVPGDLCEQTIIDNYIPGVSTTEVCTHLKNVHVSPDEKISYCNDCLPEAGYKTSVYPNLEPDLLAFYQSEKIPFRKVPEHNQSCSRVFGGKAPVIVSPGNEKEYLVGKEDQLMLSCITGNGVTRVHWFVNDRFLKTAGPSEPVFFSPSPGSNKISCSDDHGRNSDILIKVTPL